MRWKKTLQLIEVHAEGEVGKVLTSGFPNIPGNSVADKLAWMNDEKEGNSIRKLLTLEPRGALAGSVNVLLPPSHPDADAGFFVMQADQTHAMSGSNSMCLVTALLETGVVEMKEPETEVVLDTAAGLVKAKATCKDGKCERVALEMTPAYVEVLDAEIDTEEWGTVKYDVGFGGIFYAIIDADQVNLSIEPRYARELADAGAKLVGLLREAYPVQHPEIPAIKDIAYVMFRSMDDDGAVRTCTTLWPGRVDRSPCGTGSNVNLATMHARNLVKPGDQLVSRSITGGEFKVSLLKETVVAGKQAISAEISGRAWIYGIQQIGLDPSDPFPEGFVLTDTWGPLAGEIK